MDKKGSGTSGAEAQLVEHLTSTHKDLGLIPNSA